ncbi:permease [Vibrio zhanjiangensis]|uniref:Permease n=1 Tax=Vibrio zhanjiangensis TaxID=1046128 RepID=A0ABQ6EZQ3_9VIBR|nr:YoaK family protein [Vibrio zhanjiangensis]GLT18730.1 permease [Vibrio zhanjiangensis]
MKKIPYWAMAAVFILSLVAGIVNAIGFLGVKTEAVSHLTGTSTLLGTVLFNDGLMSLHIFIVILLFVIGSALSSFLISLPPWQTGKIYSLLLLAEALLFTISSVLLGKGGMTGVHLASLACGIQNGMTTIFSAGPGRTTHVTGTFTDIGIMAGSALKGESIERRKMTMLVSLAVGFISGGVVGYYLFEKISFSSLLVPAVICLILGITCYIHLRKKENGQAFVHQGS